MTEPTLICKAASIMGTKPVARAMLWRTVVHAVNRNRSLAPICFLLILAVWLLALERISFNREQTIATVIRSNESLSRVLEEQTTRTFKQVEQSLRLVSHEYEQRGRDLDIGNLIVAGQIDGSMFTNIGVTDASGRLLADNLPFKQTDLSDREYFLFLRDHPGPGLFIAKPLLGRVSGKWAVHTALRLQGPDGAFMGVVFGGIDFHYFTDFYRQADLGEQGMIALIGKDGIARALQIGDSGRTGQAMHHTALYREMSKAPTGSFLGEGRLDGVKRYISYRTLQEYPMVVAVGTSEAAVLTDIRRNEHLIYATAALASTLIAFFGCRLMASHLRRQEAMESLSASKALLQATFDQAAVGIVRASLDGRFLEVNRRFCDMVGYSEGELLARTLFDLTPPEYATRNMDFKGHLLASDEGCGELEKVYVRKDGGTIWVNVASAIVRDAHGNPGYFIGVVQDVTERKRLEERLMHESQYDSLTQLPNRLLCQDRLKLRISEARRNGSIVAVLFVDLDRFKTVNDTLGHAVGDRLLLQVAQRIAGGIRCHDTVGRFGGDEFLLVLSDLSLQDAGAIAQKVLKTLEQPFALDGCELFVTASIGIATYPADGEDAETLLKSADAAMYRAKDCGRNHYQFYTSAMNKAAAERLALESALRHALEREEFVIHYQPKVRGDSTELVGCEALLRWQHPDNGLVEPNGFIPILEESGLILPVGAWVIRTVCAQIRAWQAQGIAPVPVAVNLSTRQFLRQDILAEVETALRESGIDPSLLELEITESAAMEEPPKSVATLRALRALGVHLSIDDFGTGYSSLAYLKRLPLDSLKLDRSFVEDLPKDPDSASIAQAVITMAHSLKLKVIAEGVETEAQREFLRARQCDVMQGYLYSRPLPGDEYVRLLIGDTRRGLASCISSIG